MINYDMVQEIAEGIYWIGSQHKKYGLHSNPYLMVQGDEAILLDAGSRPDFSSVVVKILDVGINPAQVSKLIYHHYDPNLCGSLSTFENLIDNPQLEVISQELNNIYIEHYSPTIRKSCINAMNNQWAFKNGRTLNFVNIPYAHSPGSFVTYDPQTKVLFSGDLFGGYGMEWELYYDGHREDAETFHAGLKSFHEIRMPSVAALNYALDQIEKLDVEIIAPQHGSIIRGKETVVHVIEEMRKFKAVGIDCILKTGAVY